MNARNRVLPLLILMVALIAMAGTTGCSKFGKKRTKDPIHIESLEALSPNDIPPPIKLADGTSSGETAGQPETHGNLSIEATPPVRSDATMVVSELQPIHFSYDSSRILPEEQAKLQSNAQWILAHPGITIQVEGHCDERGSVEYNVNLGQRRADTVRESLYKLGIDPGMLTTITYGEERPLDPGHSEEAWAKNRRVQFLIY